MNWLRKIFHRVPVHDVLRDQLFEAERLHVEHLAAAEMHAAMAGVYRARASSESRTCSNLRQRRG